MDAQALLLTLAVSSISAAACTYGLWRELEFNWRSAMLAMPAIFVLTAVVTLALPPLTSATVVGVSAICALISEVDRRHYIIPDILVVALLAIAVAAPFVSRIDQLLGAILIGGLFLAVRTGFRQLRGAHGLGLGDVKLAAAMGALLGPTLGLTAVAIAAGATALLLAVRRAKSTTAAPFGIGLSAALAIAFMFEVWR